MFSYIIEVAAVPGTSSTERGRILEKFARRFLETQNYAVQEEVRLTASEVDLLGTDNSTGERIFVECKAYRSTISAEVLIKLLGNVTFKGYSSGWLVSTFSLGKDAKGFEDDWNQKESSERRKLRIYSPDKLISHLVKAKMILGIGELSFDRNRFRVSNDAFLLLTQYGEFWALPVIDRGTSIASAALLFEASTGRLVTDSKVFDTIEKTDTSLKLPWVKDTNNIQDIASNKLQRELESIVEVPVADHWADYRPARPIDFVGRQSVQTAIFSFLDKVRTNVTPTRLIALKGPSGWGKSSTVLKVVSRSLNRRNKGKYYLFAVDSRAAMTRRFPELAIVTAIKQAIKNGFVSVEKEIEFGTSTNLFAAPEMQNVARDLRSESKVICIFFDQFEELLYRVDLSEVFDEMRRICAAAEESQLNLVIGFSWKTDGVIPTEHSAYHMWHALADRRFEIELPPFTEQEVGLAINRFAKELECPVIPQLRRVLQDHCQGFPWLLKKLCIHILDLVQSGLDQVDILNQSINIQALFKKDLDNLSAAEMGCLQQIASESPAEFFKIAQNFGEEIVSKLINKRLVIRSATRLTIYWDIFRDYILTEKIPYIPVTYMPQSDFSGYIKALRYMDGKSSLTYDDLAKHMGRGRGGTDNLVRDLVNIGHVEANRKEQRIIPVFKDMSHAVEIVFNFWRSHEVVMRLLAKNASEVSFGEDEFIDVFRIANKRSLLGENTIHIYALRMLRWLIGINFAQQIEGSFLLRDNHLATIHTMNSMGMRRSRNPELFLGEAPPVKVLSAFIDLYSSKWNRNDLAKKHGRNTCYVLVKLGLMDSGCAPKPVVIPQNPAAFVAEKLKTTKSLMFVVELMHGNEKISGEEVGKAVAENFNLVWSNSSCRRYGCALKQWAGWSLTDW